MTSGLKCSTPRNHASCDHAYAILVAQSQRLIDLKSLGDHQEPISKTSRFWMFSNKRDCYWLGAIKEIALFSRGFSSGENIRDIRGVYYERDESARQASGTQGIQKRKNKQFCVPQFSADIEFH